MTPRGERVRGGHEGVCELEPSAAPGVERGGVDSLEEAPGHRARRAAVVAALEERPVRGVRLEKSGDAGGDGDIGLERAVALDEGRRLREGVQFVGEHPVAQARVEEQRLGVGRLVGLPAPQDAAQGLTGGSGWGRVLSSGRHEPQQRLRGVGVARGLLPAREQRDLAYPEPAAVAAGGLHGGVLARHELEVDRVARPVGEVEPLPVPAPAADPGGLVDGALARIVLDDVAEPGALAGDEAPDREVLPEVDAAGLQHPSLAGRREVGVEAGGIDPGEGSGSLDRDGEASGADGSGLEAGSVAEPALRLLRVRQIPPLRVGDLPGPGLPGPDLRGVDLCGVVLPGVDLPRPDGAAAPLGVRRGPPERVEGVVSFELPPGGLLEPLQGRCLQQGGQPVLGEGAAEPALDRL